MELRNNIVALFRGLQANYISGLAEYENSHVEHSSLVE
jgi:hypothetical protein